MSIDHLISLLALCIPLILSVTGAAIRICSKLEKISVALGSMTTKSECAVNRMDCPALQKKSFNRQRSRSAASRSLASAARRSNSTARR